MPRFPMPRAFFPLAPMLALLVTAAPPAAAPRPETYLCRLEVPRSQSWVPDQLVVLHEPGAPTAMVNDPLIRHFAGRPLPAEVVADTPDRVTFRWVLKMVKNRSGQTAAQFVYRATLQKAGLALRISAKPLGYDNFFEAGGTCTRQ